MSTTATTAIAGSADQNSQNLRTYQASIPYADLAQPSCSGPPGRLPGPGATAIRDSIPLCRLPVDLVLNKSYGLPYWIKRMDALTWIIRRRMK